MENEINKTNIGGQKLPSVLNDPFLKDKIEMIAVYYNKNIFKGNWTAWGRVEFKNGNTQGEQKFEGETFDEVVLKIKEFLNELK